MLMCQLKGSSLQHGKGFFPVPKQSLSNFVLLDVKSFWWYHYHEVVNMSRVPWVKEKYKIYHVIQRGNERKNIFE